MLRNPIEDITEITRGMLLLLTIARNLAVREDQRFIKPDLDSRFYTWLTQAPPMINPYQKALDQIEFPQEFIPESFCDPQDHTLLWDPEPQIKQQMDTFITEATKQVNAIRYRTLGSQLFCSPKPVSDDQYLEIRDRIMRDLDIENRSTISHRHAD